METAGQHRRQKEWCPACLFGAPYAQGHPGFCSGGRVRRLHGAVEPLPLGVFLRVGRRRWCWRLAGVVSCGTTSVVLVASRGRRWCWWLAGVVSCGTTSVVLVASRGRQLWSGPWSLKPAVVSGCSAHPGLAAPSCMSVIRVILQLSC